MSHGLGALEGPADDRDFPIADLFALDGRDMAVALPPSYIVPKRAPVLDQHDSPMCVAFSTSSVKSYQDRPDTAPARWPKLDEVSFFRAIGGNANGAVLRTALDRLLKVGYPTVGGVEPAAAHRIRAYYAIPKDVHAIKVAIKTYGQIVLATPWYNSWFEPDAKNVLPRPDYFVGGHAIVGDGWDEARGLRLRNSWGADWGGKGDAFLPWHYAVHTVREYWKVVDL